MKEASVVLRTSDRVFVRTETEKNTIAHKFT